MPASRGRRSGIGLGIGLATLAVAIAVFAAPVFAETYPSRTIKLIVPLPAGSTSDIITRLIAEQLRAELGQSVVVENHPGASGLIGTDLLKRAPPDGYTISIGNEGTHVSVAAIRKTVPFDAIRDFSPITLATRTTMGIAVNTAVLPVNSLGELIAYAKAHPRKVTYATSGVGTPQFFAGETLKLRTGIDMIHVPYAGAGPAATDLLGGSVSAMIATLPSIIPLEKSGPIKLIAIGNTQRMADLPDVPTTAETVPDFSFAGWNGFFAPAGVPPEIVMRLNAAMVRVIRSPEFAERMREQYIVPVGSSPEELTEVIRSGIARWSEIVDKSGFQRQ